jgi:endonuclease/exonuclease/phosphatase family metal-dependent hydrolase
MGFRFATRPRARLFVCAAAIVLSAASCAPNPRQPVETRISILQLNMRGIADVPNGDPAGFWELRYARIGADLRTLGAVPDVIALQEVTARVWCPDNHNFILDYEPLYKLIRELQLGTGVRYRIAYFQIFTRERRIGWGPTSHGGPIAECRGSSGLAMLYDPNRLVNLSVSESGAATLAGSARFNVDTPTAMLRRSMPCCAGKVRQGGELVCTLVDGPNQTDVCDSPAGLAMQAPADVAVARFALAVRAGTTFHVYNVHMPGTEQGDPPARTAVRSAITATETVGVVRWFPPVFVGDFNLPQEAVLGYLPDFQFTGEPDLDHNIHIFQGSATSFPSIATIARSETIQVPTGATSGGCVDAGVLWSDHCGLLTTFWIREP